MFALAIEFLTGRYVATAYNDRRAVEWPPHPARIFSALVATHFEDPNAEASERAALEWLERQDPPELHCSEADARDSYDVFVPVNDASIVPDVGDESSELDEARRRAAGETDPKRLRKATKEVEKLETRLKVKLAKAVGPIVGKIPAEMLSSGESLLPDRRGKQPRTFPSVTPRSPRMSLVWRGAAATNEQREILDALASRVVRIGHSSTLVSVRVLRAEEVTSTAFRVPDPDGTDLFRGVERGQLDRLVDDYSRHQGVVPGRTLPAAVHSYVKPRPPRSEAPQSVFGDDWVVFAHADGPHVPATRAVDIARAVRKVLQHFGEQPPSEFVSGHQAAGSPSERPHLAIVSLPFVGHVRADGNLRGIALIFPRDSSLADRRSVLRAVHGWEASPRARRPEQGPAEVPVFGPAGLSLWLRRQTTVELDSLRPDRWCASARRWATVTPVALDRHPGDLRARDPDAQVAATSAASESIRQACQRIGLPRPWVSIVPAAPVAAAIKAQEFPAFPPVEGRTRRVLTHAVLEFEQPVQGPLIIGAGRYHGLGLFLPLYGVRP